MRSRICILRDAGRHWTSTPRCRRLPAGRYRVYGDIVHESGYAQTLVSSVDLNAGGDAASPTPMIRGSAAEAARRSIRVRDGTQPGVGKPATRSSPARSGAGVSVRDATGAIAGGRTVHGDGRARDRRQPRWIACSPTCIRRAASRWRRCRNFPCPESRRARGIAGWPRRRPVHLSSCGRYRMWVQFKRSGEIKTAAFDFHVK